ncbi:hypothetical protein BJ742DRAFT_124694 [Cladochytrium replicatum]|nr:hypothetical protein BJ742DRAFT_124694 [Cladochytrium replicatum]
MNGDDDEDLDQVSPLSRDMSFVLPSKDRFVPASPAVLLPTKPVEGFSMADQDSLSALLSPLNSLLSPLSPPIPPTLPQTFHPSAAAANALLVDAQSKRSSVRRSKFSFPSPLLIPKSSDGMRLDLAKLPLPIVEAVVSRMRSTADIISCMLVNRHWSVGAAKALYRHPNLPTADTFQLLVLALLNPIATHPYPAFVHELKFRPALSENILMGDVDVALQLFPNLRTLYLDRCPTASNVLVQSLSDHSRQLRRLYLSNTPITDAFIPDLVRSCPKLEDVDFSHTGVTVGVIRVLIDKCESIHSIALEGCGPSSKSVSLDPTSTFIRPLRVLNLKNSGIQDHVFRYAAMRCPDLHTVILEGCAAITDDSIVKLAFGSADLRKLDLSFCPYVTDLSLHALSMHSKALRSLNLSGCDAITPDAVHNLSKSCPRLDELILHGCARILTSFVRDYSTRQYELDCAIRGASIQWLAGHKAQQELRAKSQSMQIAQATQTDSEANIDTDSFDSKSSATTLASRDSIGLSKDTAEVLMKFAEAIVEGKWVPPGANWGASGNVTPRAWSDNKANSPGDDTSSATTARGSQPWSEWHPSWGSPGAVGSQNGSTPGTPPNGRTSWAPADTRRISKLVNQRLSTAWSDNSSSGSSTGSPVATVSTTKPISNGRKPITGLPVPTRIPSSRLSVSIKSGIPVPGGVPPMSPSRIPGARTSATSSASEASPRTSWASTTSPASTLPRPSTGLPLPTPTRTSVIVSKLPTVAESPRSMLPSPSVTRTAVSTPSTPASGYKPRQFKKFNDDGLGVASFSVASKTAGSTKSAATGSPSSVRTPLKVTSAAARVPTTPSTRTRVAK